MKEHYWMSKEHGYLVPESSLYEDALAMELDDITDPTSVEYLNFSLHYCKTHLLVL